jgi:hypothetical protein
MFFFFNFLLNLRFLFVPYAFRRLMIFEIYNSNSTQNLQIPTPFLLRFNFEIFKWKSKSYPLRYLSRNQINFKLFMMIQYFFVKIFIDKKNLKK